jgi:hypothetical protein
MCEQHISSAFSTTSNSFQDFLLNNSNESIRWVYVKQYTHHYWHYFIIHSDNYSVTNFVTFDLYTQ